MFKNILIVLAALPILLNGQISLLSPFGGEYLQIGGTTSINWETSETGTVEILFSSNGGTNWTSVQSNVDAALSVYSWEIPNLNSNQCKIKIESENGAETTSYNFAIGGESQLPEILADEEYNDWATFPDLAQIAPDEGDMNALKVINDDRMLYIYFETDDVLSLQNDNSLSLYMDTDNDTSTGKSVNGIGAEIEFNFGERRGTVYVNNVEHEVGVGNFFLIISPTIWSDKFELTLNLDSNVGGKDLFASPRIRLLIKDDASGVSTPSESGGAGYALGEYEFTPPKSYSIVKQSDDFLRVLSHNVLFSNFMKPEATEVYKRLYRAIQPDIIGFSELYDDYSISEIETRMEEILPSNGDKSWNVERTKDNVLATRYHIKYNSSVGPFGNGAFLIDLRPQYNSDLLLIVAHPPCCDNDPSRQDEADAMAGFVRDAKAPGGELTISENTPVVIVGDMNFVGDPRQPLALIDGDIVQESTYGSDYIPDWDGTSFEDSKPVTTNLPHTFTQGGWGSPGSYSKGRLDYIIYSGSVLNLENSFVVYTPAMPQDTLTLYGMQNDDTDNASDHLPVVADFKLSHEQEETVIYSSRYNDENGIPLNVGQVVTVNGIVTSANDFGTDDYAFIQDNQAGIALAGSDIIAQLSNGDSITVSGTISELSGLTQISLESQSSNLTIHKSTEIPAPMVVTIGDVNNQEWNGTELLEGRLLRIENVSILAGGDFAGDQNYDITDGVNTISVRIDGDIDLVNSQIPKNNVNITGCLGQFKDSIPYNEGYQLLPRSSNDLEIISAIEHVSILALRENDSDGVPVYNNSTVSFSGVVTAKNQFGGNGPAFIQDSEAGMAVYGSAFVSKMTMGDSVTVTGYLVNYRGLSEFTFVGETSGTVVHGYVGVPEPKVVNISEILEQDWNGVELLEGSLVELKNVEFVESGSFEAWKNYSITDGTNTMTFRINNEGILDGVPIPAGKVTVRGIVGQYKSSAPYNSGYQLLPRSVNDIIINTSSGSIEINSPNGGDEYEAGSAVGISWSSQDVDYVDLHYKLSMDNEWNLIAEELDAASGRYSWWSPQSTSDSGYIKITDSYDNSNSITSAMFYILIPTSVEDHKIPAEYYLAQNFPNPFNPETHVNFGLPESSSVSLDLYDSTGRRIKNMLTDTLNPGHYSVLLIAENLASGIYFCQMKTPQYISVKKLSYIK